MCAALMPGASRSKNEHCIPWILELGRVVSFYVDSKSGNGSSARMTAPDCGPISPALTELIRVVKLPWYYIGSYRPFHTCTNPKQTMILCDDGDISVVATSITNVSFCRELWG